MIKGKLHLVIKGISHQGASVALLEQRSIDNTKTGFYEIRFKLLSGSEHYYGMHNDLECASMLFDACVDQHIGPLVSTVRLV